MGDDQDAAKSEADRELEREIRAGREFSLADAIGRLAGPGAMKGASPVSGLEQAGAEIESWLRRRLTDGPGALQAVLLRRVTGSELLLNNFDRPLVVLAGYCQKVLGSDYDLTELVREADVEWGHALDERPHFEREGAPADPDDPYTVESVRTALSGVIRQLAAGEA
ncbi:MAG TPA: hypothetical protein VGF55_21540 [Gemmataceae bacterium]|jgi:hypothetical protein